MITVGRVCMKMAGRDAGKLCVVVEAKGSKVLVDGQTRRRMCNILHLEPLDKTLDISSGASHADVVSAFKELGVEIVERKKRAAKPRSVSKKVIIRKAKKPKIPKTKQAPTAPTTPASATKTPGVPALQKG